MRLLLFFSLLITPLFASYSSIKEVLSEYKRPFSILELGAKNGDLALSLAKEFPDAVVILVEQNIGLTKKRADLLFERLQKEHPKNVLLLNKTLTLFDLEKLSNVEHFDVVIARNFLSKVRLPKSATPYTLFHIARNLGDHLFIETSPEEESLFSLLQTENTHEELLFEENTSLFHYYTNDPVTLQENWFSSTPLPPLFQGPTFSYQLKKLDHPPFSIGEIHPPGLSLITFQALRGSWPTKESLQKTLSLLPPNIATMLSPSSIILQGETLHINPTHTPMGVAFTSSFLECTTQKELKSHLYPTP